MGIRVAILGATGAVGEELLGLLEERRFPVSHLVLLASSRSAGKSLRFCGEAVPVREVKEDSFKGVELVLSSAGGAVSRQYAPAAVQAGAVVVDNTSCFRMDPEVPLVVPEINPQDIARHQGIIANPNCSTIILALVLWPLHREFGVRRAVVATYQAASGAGRRAMRELMEETRNYLEGKPYERTVIPHPYAFNLFPHDSPMGADGYCQEESKMMRETRKLFDRPDFRLTATCVRVPVLRAHSESLNAELEKPADVEAVYRVLRRAPGVEVLEDREANRWPMPTDATGRDPVYAGRVRRDGSTDNGFELWVTGDQLRKGAALNAIQIAEALF